MAKAPLIINSNLFCELQDEVEFYIRSNGESDNDFVYQ